MNGIEQLGHTGLWVNDLATMRHFYAEVLGLTITDEDAEEGMVFLSSRPDVEHHELVLGRGRQGGADVKVVHQLSWRLDNLQALIDFHARFKSLGVRVQQEVTHGNALGIYFFDPEGNRNEVYWPTGKVVRQPFRKSINLGQSAEAVLDEARRLLDDDSSPRYQPVRS